MPEKEKSQQYSSLVGVVFVFNLIVGTGALALPKAFQMAGWGLGIIMIILIAMTSFMTVTFVIESLASASAIQKLQRQLHKKQDVYRHLENSHTESNQLTEVEDENNVENETQSLLHNKKVKANKNYFSINEPIELGQMANIFFNRTGYYLFYLCLIVYMYGDLAIYAAAVPKTLRDVACTFSWNKTNMSVSWSNICDICPPLNSFDPCWASSNLKRIDVYRIFVVLFALILGPLVYFNIQKTKYLQFFTKILRWLAFFMMIVLTIRRLAIGQGDGHPPEFNFKNAPNLFGICIYSFMCHHSLPQILSPIRNKNKISLKIGLVYLMILLFYCLLSLTGIFAFANIYDLYTLNFQPPKCGYLGLQSINTNSQSATGSPFIQYFLALFPVFTISASFPIIGITLRNNLRSIFINNEKNLDITKSLNNFIRDQEEILRNQGQLLNQDEQFIRNENINLNPNLAADEIPHTQEHDLISSTSVNKSNLMWTVDRLLFPTIVLIIPIIVAIISSDIQVLVGITGSYAGAGIQYIIPAGLVILSRKKISAIRMLIRQLEDNRSSNRVNRLRSKIDTFLNNVNYFESPFQNKIWVMGIFAWSILCIILVTLNNIWSLAVNI